MLDIAHTHEMEKLFRSVIESGDSGLTNIFRLPMMASFTILILFLILTPKKKKKTIPILII